MNDIIRELLPGICQRRKDDRDYITKIELSDSFTPDHIYVEEVPELYYKYSSDEDFHYGFFMIYHPFDWSNSWIPFIRKADSHRHDTESILIRMPKDDTIAWKDVCGVSHNRFKFKKYWSYREDRFSDPFIIKIESGSHAICLDGFKGSWANKDEYLHYTFDDFKMVNLEEMSTTTFTSIKAILNFYGVNWVDQQYDFDMKHKFANRRKSRHLKGDMYNRPVEVFKLAERMNRI